jgi:hypothetical protein
MPNSLFVFLTGEGFLIGLTTVLLAQPRFIFKSTPKPFQSWAFLSGWVILVILFFWSILLGKILSNYEISIHF